MHSGYIVLMRQTDGSWPEAGVVDRQPGLAARASRRRSIEVATGADPGAGEFAVVPLSEWRQACNNGVIG